MANSSKNNAINSNNKILRGFNSSSKNNRKFDLTHILKRLVDGVWLYGTEAGFIILEDMQKRNEQGNANLLKYTKRMADKERNRLNDLHGKNEYYSEQCIKQIRGIIK